MSCKPQQDFASQGHHLTILGTFTSIVLLSEEDKKVMELRKNFACPQ